MFHRIVASLLTLLGGALLVVSESRADDSLPVADKDVRSFVDRRIQEWLPTADEKRGTR